jgi:hypothetical protein
MKPAKYMLTLPLTLMSFGIAQAKGDIFYDAPFSNIEIKPASKIYVRYQFDPQKKVLVCKAEPDTDAITSAEWEYKDATRKVELPVVLKDNSHTEGHYADPEGKLVITNEFGSNANGGNIYVSCDYRRID